MTLLHTLTSRSRLHDALLAVIGNREMLLVACDDGKVRIYDGLRNTGPDATEEDLVCVAELVGHANRSVDLNFGQRSGNS